MNISQTIKPWGNSVGIRLPQAVTKEAGVGIGQRLDISLENGRIVLTPVKTETASLDSLLRKITSENLHSSIDAGKAQGNEAW